MWLNVEALLSDFLLPFWGRKLPVEAESERKSQRDDEETYENL